VVATPAEPILVAFLCILTSHPPKVSLDRPATAFPTAMWALCGRIVGQSSTNAQKKYRVRNSAFLSSIKSEEITGTFNFSLVQ
jgi:hypothetical protein